MTTDFRALCAELHAAFTTYAVDECHHNLLERARAALADEQASVTENPTDEDLLNLHDWMTDEWATNHDFELPPSQYAHAVLALWGNPTPQLPASVAKEPRPTDQQLKTFACEWWHKFGFVKNKATCTWVIDEIAPEHFVDFMRSVLARWGNPAPQLPVSLVGEPTQRQLMMLADEMNLPSVGDAATYARAVLNRWGRSALQPADDEVADCLANSLKAFLLTQNLADYPADHWSRRAADLLERRHTPQPVPVSERLLGPEDCDGEGKCWWFHDEDNASCSHWLPAHALPLPTAND